jgi:hypothetical protein
MSEDAEVRRAVFDEGQRLACPAGCAPARFAVMQACWAAGQDARPSFDALAASLQAAPPPPPPPGPPPPSHPRAPQPPALLALGLTRSAVPAGARQPRLACEGAGAGAPPAVRALSAVRLARAICKHLALTVPAFPARRTPVALRGTTCGCRAPNVRPR